eukprot:scaffold106874_cov62-Attheya_sp.AAC.1
MQDNECADNGELAKMSSSDYFFSENIQVDLDDPGIWKAKGHYQSNSNNEGHNQQESNGYIDDKDYMQSENTEESGMDGVLNRSIDALPEMA